MKTDVKLGISKTFGPVFSLIQTDEKGVIRLMDGTWPDDTKAVDEEAWHAAADKADAALAKEAEKVAVSIKSQTIIAASTEKKLLALGLSKLEVASLIPPSAQLEDLNFVAPTIQRPPPT